MSNFPKIKEDIYLLRRYRDKKGLNNATLAASMQAFGWEWTATQLDNLLNGTVKPSSDINQFIRLYLLDIYETEALT